MPKYDEKRKPDIFRVLSTYLIPAILVIAGLAIAQDRLARAEEDIEDKVDIELHTVVHEADDQREDRVDEQLVRMSQELTQQGIRIEQVNYRQNAQQIEILTAIEALK